MYVGNLILIHLTSNNWLNLPFGGYKAGSWARVTRRQRFTFYLTILSDPLYFLPPTVYRLVSRYFVADLKIKLDVLLQIYVRPRSLAVFFFYETSDQKMNTDTRNKRPNFQRADSPALIRNEEPILHGSLATRERERKKANI